MSRNSNGINFFGPPLMAGVPIAQQQGMIDKINTLCAVLANLDGENGITLVREGKQWAIVLNASSILYGNVDSESNGGDQLPWTPRLYRDEYDAWRLEITRCGYVRGPVTVLLADLDFELPDPPEDGAGNYWIGVKIDTEAGTVAGDLLCSRTASDVFDAMPPDDKHFKRLLYAFTYTAASAGVDASWSIKSGWYRLLPELGAYV